MSLMVYDWIDEKEKTIPKQVIRGNDLFFLQNTLLEDTTIVREILKLVDQATYFDKEYFTDRFGAKVSREFLSTGCKTALNVIQNPEYCFTSIECGANAMQACLFGTEGSVVWWGDGLDKYYDRSCDIIYKGKHFDVVKDFVHYFWEVC